MGSQVPQTRPARQHVHKYPWPCVPESSPVTKTLVLTVAACANSAVSASRQGSFMVVERGHGLLAPPPLPSRGSGGGGRDSTKSCCCCRRVCSVFRRLVCPTLERAARPRDHPSFSWGFFFFFNPTLHALLLFPATSKCPVCRGAGVPEFFRSGSDRFTTWRRHSSSFSSPLSILRNSLSLSLLPLSVELDVPYGDTDRPISLARGEAYWCVSGRESKGGLCDKGRECPLQLG